MIKTVKQNHLTLLLAFAALLTMPFTISCTKSNEDGENQKEQTDEKQEPEGPQAGTYTLTASPLMSGWKAGDKIYIHGAYGPAAQMVTLSSSDISSDGRTASVKLDDVLEYSLKPDYLYAAWPGEAVLQNDGIMSQSTEFTSYYELLSVAYLKDTDFAFVDASTCLKFKGDGYSEFAFAGNQRPGLRFTGYEALYSSTESDFFERQTDGYPFYDGKMSDGAATLWLPGTITFKSGFTIYLGKDGEWPVCYTVKEDIRLNAGEVKDLGDISAKLEAYSGPAPKMPEMGARTKYTVTLNELSGLCLSKDGDFLWGVGDDGDLAHLSFEGEVSGKVHIGGDCEAISRDPSTGDLILGMEPNTVGKIESPDFNKKVSLFTIADAKGYGNAGQEGLTYYKDGMIYCGMQTASELYCIKLDTGEVLWKKGMREIFPSITEIADLCYDPLTDWLWIIDSEAKKFFALTGDAQNMLGAYSIKTTDNPESICVDHTRHCIWVGDDYGSTSFLYRYDFTGLDDAIINKQ